MRNAADYLTYIKTLLISAPHITHFTTIREETQDKKGLLRYRASLDDGSLLEIFEFFEMKHDGVHVSKYSFHWQDRDGNLLKRWDNASHHPEITTHPHHIHIGAEDAVFPHAPATCDDIITHINEHFDINRDNENHHE